MVSVGRESVDCVFNKVEVAHHQVREREGFSFELELQVFEEGLAFSMVVRIW